MNRQQFTGLVVVALLALHASLAVHSLWIKSTTFDESTHLPAGLAFVATGEVRLNPQHPPLAKLLAGLAASTLNPALPLDGNAYRQGREWDFGRQVLYESGNDSMALLRRGRLPIVGLSVLGALGVFLWSRRRHGDGAALVILAFYALSPTVLAHARWVTMDAGVTAFAVWTLFLWQCLSDAPSRRLGLELACGLALGLALATKFSALLLLPGMALAELFVHRQSWRQWQRWRRRCVSWAVILVTAALVVESTYLGFHEPFRYWRDLGLVYGDTNPNYSYYLLGEFREGFPHYFLIAMLVKTTLPGLAVMLGGLTLAGIQRRAADLYLVVPAAIWFAVTTAKAAPWGVRYVLPLYPLLFVLASALVPWIWKHPQRLARAAIVLLVVAHGSETLKAHPDYLPYFNQIAGGPRGGIHWLANSNLDWGQDLYRLPDWLAERGIRSVRLLYFGKGVPASYGVPEDPMYPDDWNVRPRPGVYAISAQSLVRGLSQADSRGLACDWLRRYEPVDVLGGSIYLYAFE